MEHNYTVEYKKRKESKADDALSRQYEKEEGDLKVLMVTITRLEPKWVEEVKFSYFEDDKTQQLITQTLLTLGNYINYSVKEEI